MLVFRKILDICMYFFLMVFTSCKAEQPLQGMDLQEKEAQKD